MARSGTERRYGRFARRALALALLTAGWTTALAFAGTVAHAAGTYDGSTGPTPVRQLAGALDHTLRDLARAAESVPRTLHHVTGTVASPTTAPVSSPHVQHRIGDTPRALGRPGHARHKKAAAQVLPTRQHPRGVTAVQALPARRHPPGADAVRVLPARRHPPTGAAGRVLPIRRHAPTVAPVRTKTAQVVRHVLATELQHPRAPAPYAPTAPESLTAGPAVPPKGIAGPALALTHHPHLNAPRVTRDEAPARMPVPAPAVSGIPGCSPD